MCVAFCAVSLSCSSRTDSAQHYAREISDNVRFYVAYARYWSRQISRCDQSEQAIAPTEEAYDAFEQMKAQFEKRYSSHDTATCEEVLEGVAEDPMAEFRLAAHAVLEEMDEVEIRLSEFKPAASSNDTKTWIFTELRSRVVFIFALNDYRTPTPRWICYPEENSYKAYLDALTE